MKHHIRIDDDYHIGSVEYIDYANDTIHPINRTQSINSYSLLLTKRMSFSHEKEVRILATKHPQRDGEDVLGGSNPFSELRIPIDLSNLVSSIVISPLAPEWVLEAVTTMTQKHINDKVTIHQSKLYDDQLY